MYVYATKAKLHLFAPNGYNEHYWTQKHYNGNHTLNGKVVAKFTLNKVEKLDIPYPAYFHEVAEKYAHIVEEGGVSLHELHRYFGTKTGYALHIDNLEIFPQPLSLSDFGLKRASQSWCYIKEEAK